jgi:hypothetical protein
VVLGPTALVADDLAAGLLLAPFPGVTLPTRGYHAYLSDAQAGGRSALWVCQWLEEIGRTDTYPDPTLRAAGLLGVPPNECLAAEVLLNGIRADHAAGVMPVMVPTYCSPQRRSAPCETKS